MKGGFQVACSRCTYGFRAFYGLRVDIAPMGFRVSGLGLREPRTLCSFCRSLHDPGMRYPENLKRLMGLSE